MRRRFRVSVLAVALLGAAVVPTVLLASSSTKDGTTPPVSQVDPSIHELLGVFNQQQETTDRIAVSAESADVGSDALPGENIDLSRRADGPGTDSPVYLWPKSNGVCFAAEGVSSCADANDLAEREVILALYRGAAAGEGKTRVAGIAVN